MLGNISMHRYKKRLDATSTLGDRLAICYKAKHNLAIESSNCTPRYLPNWVEMLYSFTQKLACKRLWKFHSKSLKFSITMMSFIRWMDKQTDAFIQ